MFSLIKKKIFSVKVPLVLLIMAAGLVPLLVYAQVTSGLIEKSQLDSRNVEIQNQCLILTSKITRAGDLAEKIKDPAFATEINVTADLFNGRIFIVDQNYRIIKDSFDLAEGKIAVAKEVMRCFQGESGNVNNQDKNYLVQTFPVYDNSPERKIQGVMVVSSSTENLTRIMGAVRERSRLLLITTAALMVLVSMLAARMLVRPFDLLQNMLAHASEGDIETDIDEHTYQETRGISEAVSQTLSKLKAVDQSRQEFVSNVSHELKTPITSIRVLADSIMGMEDAPIELYQEFMQDISDEIDRESKIIDDLLALVKMDKSAPDHMNIQQISVNDLLEMILKRLSPIAQKKNIELILESIRDVVADVDEVKLSLALTNLVENAVKYNKEGGWVKVTLNADHKAFYITVSDSGIGIPEAFQERVFDRFYRVDKARSKEGGGTGLGLAITKNVILMHRGTIKLESREEEGTTFSVRIPLNYVLPPAKLKGGKE